MRWPGTPGCWPSGLDERCGIVAQRQRIVGRVAGGERDKQQAGALAEGVSPHSAATALLALVGGLLRRCTRPRCACKLAPATLRRPLSAGICAGICAGTFIGLTWALAPARQAA